MLSPIHFLVLTGTMTGVIVKLAAVAAVPYAMSYFGVVVPGVGTMYVAGGVAATL